MIVNSKIMFCYVVLVYGFCLLSGYIEMVIIILATRDGFRSLLLRVKFVKKSAWNGI